MNFKSQIEFDLNEDFPMKIGHGIDDTPIKHVKVLLEVSGF